MLLVQELRLMPALAVADCWSWNCTNTTWYTPQNWARVGVSHWCCVVWRAGAAGTWWHRSAHCCLLRLLVEPPADADNNVADACAWHVREAW